MRERQFEALRDAAADGVDFEGLSVRTAGDGDGYAFAVPGDRRDGLSEAALREAAEAHAEYATNWFFWEREVGGRGSHRRAFLRWLEGADERPVPERYDALAGGVVREWGELLVTATLDGEGGRRYEIRHAADGGAPRDELDVRADPLDAREIRTFDDRGRYRPLKTAPSLPDGWAFVDLDARAVYEAVDTFYPATVANWSLERDGELDVSHWRETAERQSGIYDVVDELPEEAVNWMAEACCVDSQCLRRREWQYDEETPLSPDGGDGEFPCREPCSLVVAAARKWTMLEREETRTYEFELTPSEREQVEEIVDAVADGRVDEVREAEFDDGANRYRARYLRAKRFDGEGDGVDDDGAENESA